MKQLFAILALCTVVVAGCKKSPYLLYSDINRVQMDDTTTISETFIFEPATLVRDTVYIRINTMGGISPVDRPVKLVQIPEYTYTYTRDPITNQVTDSVKNPVPNTAKPGIHYIDFNDKAVQNLLVIKANEAQSSLPVILLRDTSLKSNSYRLRLKLEANDQFGLGETKFIERTIVFSDRLERFESWKVDSYSAPAFSWFGKYSVGKHQFMIDVLKQDIDEKWFKASVELGALNQFVTVLKQALSDFNSNPDNIASGKAPVRETSSPTSTPITFP